jgi:hypothetical protein
VGGMWFRVAHVDAFKTSSQTATTFTVRLKPEYCRSYFAHLNLFVRLGTHAYVYR